MELLALQLPYGQLNLLLDENRRLIQVQSSEITASQVGTIYVGRVDQVKKNINSAFVSIGNGEKVFLSFEQLSKVFYVKKTGKGNLPVQGDELLIQIDREAYANKLARGNTAISLSGRYAVLTTDKQGVFVSSKIQHQNYRKSLKQKLKPFLKNKYGIIVRTNAQEVPYETLVEDIEALTSGMEGLLENLPYKAVHQTVYSPLGAAEKMIQNLKGLETLSVRSNDGDLLRRINAMPITPMTISTASESLEALEAYTNLYNIKGALEKLFRKRVWLKSGATIVIEPTEAMTVIDVNTEKTIRKGKDGSTILETNLEAAAAAAKALRLRNISGIVIIDFIDMKSGDDKKALVAYMEQLCLEDPVSTTVHGLTTLGLMEITRKKLEKPIYEQEVVKKYIE